VFTKLIVLLTFPRIFIPVDGHPLAAPFRIFDDAPRPCIIITAHHYSYAVKNM
jgi:hypothetical protein